MKLNSNYFKVLFIMVLLTTGCTSQKKLAYLNNLPLSPGEQFFPMDIPDYKIQNRDVLYITLKAMNPQGMITDFLSGSAGGGTAMMQGEGSGYLIGFNVNKDGNIIIPVLGAVKVEGQTIDEVRNFLQQEFNKSYKNAVIECKLLSYKFTVIGSVNNPGTYVNYNNYLTVLEALGRAGGIGDFGNRDRILVVRPTEKGTKTYRINLHDKGILSSEAYFLQPNDVVIVEPLKQKIFNMNLPTISFIITTFSSALTVTLLMINYLK